ncbi:uncharacterized protein LOC144166775 [Haemaphysalis longicornis]
MIPEAEIVGFAQEQPCLDTEVQSAAVQKFMTSLKARGVDLLMPCDQTVNASVSGCWIASQVAVLNSVLESISLELRESSTGALSLINVAPSDMGDCRPDSALSDAAFLTSWILNRHRCLRTVNLDGEADLFECAPSAVANALASNQSVTEVRLGLSRSAIRTKAFSVLVGALPHMGGLKRLELVGQVESSAVTGICSTLKAGRLTSLLIERFPENKKAAAKISRALLASASLTSLIISRGATNLPRLVPLLKTNTALRTLSLTVVSGELVGEVLSCLAHNTAIEELCLSDAPLEDYPVPTAPIYEFAANRSVKVLRFRNIELCEAGAMAFAELLRDNTTLEEVEFSGCRVGDFGTNALADAMAVNSTLRALCLEHSQISEQVVERFLRVTSHNKSLEKVNLGIVALPEDWALPADFDFSRVCGRLEVTWNGWGLEQIAKCLSRQTPDGQPEGNEKMKRLRLCWTRRVLMDSIHRVLDAASVFVVELTIGSEHSDEKGFGEAISALLISTRFLKKLVIKEVTHKGPVIPAVLGALAQNHTVCSAQFSGSLRTAQVVKPLIALLKVNKTLHSIAFRAFFLDGKPLARFVKGIQGNEVLTDLSFQYEPDRESMRPVWEILWRNRGLLTRAVNFALGRENGIESAEAFHKLADRTSLLDALTEATGKTLADCEQIVSHALGQLQKPL